MILANPIYDVVFKYLMEDTEIARLLLSKIIEEDIVEIELSPREVTTKSKKFEILILRMDFKAVIKTQTGERKKVLIELQKGKDPGDIIRFRKYLGTNYMKEDDLSTGEKASLPIITIYFLGFLLDEIDTPILEINRTYIDKITKKPIAKTVEFVEKLSHDSFVIQIRRLDKKDRTELERILKVFNQTYIREEDSKMLEIKEEELKGDELLWKLAQRLRMAATEEEIIDEIELLHEVESRIEQHIRQEQALEDRNNELKGKNNELKSENDELKKRLEELEKQLRSNNK